MRLPCPSVWYLPSDDEWTTLTTFLGGEEAAGGKFKETGTTHWIRPNTGADNISGFTFLPGGNRYTDGKFYNLINNAHYWSSTGNGGAYAWSRSLYQSSEGVNREAYNSSIGFSVRCLQNDVGSEADSERKGTLH